MKKEKYDEIIKKLLSLDSIDQMIEFLQKSIETYDYDDASFNGDLIDLLNKIRNNKMH